jgi:hypothetical protein
MSEVMSKNQNVRFTAPTQWQAELLTANPLFADLCQLFPFANQPDFPTVTELNQWLALRQPQVAMQFVADEVQAQDGRYYEVFIHQTGQIPTRPQNWHDLFGALIWCLFPNTKTLLNQLHMQEIKLHGQQQRSKLRNKLTLLDECGVILAYSPAATELIEQLQQHQWQAAFVSQRHCWSTPSAHSCANGSASDCLARAQLMPLMFGHANYEMATQPFIGLTGKLVALPVTDDFWQLSLGQRYAAIDKALSLQIANSDYLLQAAQLTPLPLLGVPGWYAANTEADFYLDQQYFRPLPLHRRAALLHNRESE